MAGLFAAVAVVIGDYVLFVHEVRIDPTLTRLGYLDSHAMSYFVHNFGTVVHGMDYLWIAIAAYAAIRTTGGALRRVSS